jgi:hypothetical protein
MPAGTRIFSAIATLVNASRAIATLVSPSCNKSPFAACPLERAPQINELPREAMSDLARHAQLKADQNGIAPLAPLGSSAFVLPICWLLPP